jgi:hypothetical protein
MSIAEPVPQDVVHTASSTPIVDTAKGTTTSAAMSLNSTSSSSAQAKTDTMTVSDGSDLTTNTPIDSTSTGVNSACRKEWAMKLRKVFSPKDMLHPDGSINQDYFKPPSMKWTDADRLALLAGIEQFGVGEWTSIMQECLAHRVSVTGMFPDVSVSLLL